MDSRKVASDQSTQLHYGGRALASGQECFWKVQVWTDTASAQTGASRALDDGLLGASDWHAKWIGLDSPESKRPTNVLYGAQWIWFPEGQPEKAAPVSTRYFRR